MCQVLALFSLLAFRRRKFDLCRDIEYSQRRSQDPYADLVRVLPHHDFSILPAALFSIRFRFCAGEKLWEIQSKSVLIIPTTKFAHG